MKKTATVVFIVTAMVIGNANKLFANDDKKTETTIENPCAVSTPYNVDWKKQLFNGLKKQNVGSWGVNVVMLGDSITALWRNSNYADGVEVMKKYRKEYKNINPYSFAISGDESQNTLWQITEGDILNNINCKVITLMIGINSLNRKKTSEQVAEGIKVTVETIRSKKPQAQILLLAVWPCWDAKNPIRNKITKTNEIIKELASDDKITYMDLGAHFINPDGEMNKKLVRDGIHLTEEGYEMWGSIMFPVISEMIAAKNK